MSRRMIVALLVINGCSGGAPQRERDGFTGDAPTDVVDPGGLDASADAEKLITTDQDTREVYFEAAEAQQDTDGFTDSSQADLGLEAEAQVLKDSLFALDPEATELFQEGYDAGTDITNDNETFICENPLPPDSASCVATPGSAWLLLQGDIVVPQGILQNGHVLVDPSGYIRCVGCDCSQAQGYADATRVECRYGLISPGLINAHDHITYTGNYPADHGDERYDHRHEWRKGLNGHTALSVPQTSSATAWGELRQVLAGTTSLFGSGGVPGLLRNLDTANSGLDPSKKVTYDTFPLGDSQGIMLVGSCAYPSIQSASSVALMHCYIPHVAEGVNEAARNEFLCLSGARPGGQDLVRQNTAFIHAIALTPSDIALMAADGTGLVWSPRSNLDLYGNTAPVTVYARLGVKIALGSDWTASGSMNILRELQCADDFNRIYLNGFFSDRDLLDMVTVRAAEIMHLDDLIGSLKPGLLADISIFDTRQRSGERAVIEAGVQDVVLVLRAGLPLYGDASVMAKIPNGSEGCEELEVCGRMKRVCAERETGKTVAALKPASAYPLFFCGKPEDEPSCKPFRPGEYDGNPTEADLDGDGVPNEKDLCPTVFDPPRPLDKGKQGDADNDGIGDACDPCPLLPFATDCLVADPSDPDGDGVPSGLDNCPSVSNPGQEDADLDGKGDACDPCPNAFNPGLDPCPATVRDLKTGAIPLNTRVSIGPVVVTGVGKKDTTPIGFFVQMLPTDPGYEGVQWSGIYVYFPAGAGKVVPGDLVKVVGTVQDYYGQTQIAQVTDLTVVGKASLPDPVVVLPQQVSTGGPLASPLEGTVIRVENVTVTNVTPPPGPGDTAPTYEFVVNDVLRVNDFIYRIDPFPSLGDGFDSITGILRYANGNSKLEPRWPSDVVLAAPRLLAIEPPLGFVLAGAGQMVPVPGMKIRLSHAATNPLFVSILSEDPMRLAIVDDGVLVPTGASEAEFEVIGLVGGPDPVPVTARLGDAEASANIRVVLGEEEPSLQSLDPAEVQLELGRSAEVLAILDIPAFTGPLSLLVSSDPQGIVSHPAEVIVSEWHLSAPILLVAQGIGEATLSVAQDTRVLFAHVIVTKPAFERLLLAEVYYDHPGADDGFEWIKIYNGTKEAVDLAQYSIGMGGVDYTVGKYALTGFLEPGQCALVGGPNSVPENGSPLYTQVLNFNPDLQNSDTVADGIALFAVPASNISKTTVPIDAVIYGVVNSNGLMDHTGGPGPVHVGDAAAGQSLLRVSVEKWVINPKPSPNVCVPIE